MFFLVDSFSFDLIDEFWVFNQRVKLRDDLIEYLVCLNGCLLVRHLLPFLHLIMHADLLYVILEKDDFDFTFLDIFEGAEDLKA